MGRTFGWVRQAPDDGRDIKFHVSRHLLAVIPATIDLTLNMGPQLDQETIGSCGPNSADEEIMFDQKVEGRPVVSASRLFIYYNTRVLMNTVNQDSGVDNRNMLKALAKWGYCPESEWPYNVNAFTHKPPASCYQAALPNCIKQYAAVATTVAAGRACLGTGRPFLWGGEVFQGIESDQASTTGIIPVPSPGETPIGGHDMTVCGATLVQMPGVKHGNIWPANTIRVRNHWMNGPGEPWGDGGYGYIPFSYAFNPNLCGDFWTITQAN